MRLIQNINVKTVIARFSEVKKLYSENELTGTDEEGSSIDVNKISTALRTAGIDLNKYFLGEVGLDDIFMELASKWKSLTQVQQRYIATQAAGSRQQSRFIALMSDYERMQQLVAEAYDSTGASARQFEKTQDSLESKLNKLSNAWDAFTMGLANNEAIKSTVELLTNLLNVVNKLTSAFGGGWTSVINAAIVAGGIFGGGKLFNGISAGIGGMYKNAGGNTSGWSNFSAGWNGYYNGKLDTRGNVILDENGNPVEGQKVQTPWGNFRNQAGNTSLFQDFLTGREIKQNEKNISNLQNDYNKIIEEEKQLKDIRTNSIKESSKNFKALADNEKKAAHNHTVPVYSSAKTLNTNNWEKFVNSRQAAKEAVKAHSAKVEERIQKEAELKAAKENNDALKNGRLNSQQIKTQIAGYAAGIGTLVSLSASLVSNMDGASESTKKVASSISTIGTSTAIGASAFGIWGAAAGLVLSTIVEICNNTNILKSDFQIQREEAEKFAEAANNTYKEAAQKVDDLTSSFERLNSAENTLDLLTNGSYKWKEQLSEINNLVSDLIKKYPELYKYVTFDENGNITITKDNQEKAAEEAKKIEKQSKLETDAAKYRTTKTNLDDTTDKSFQFWTTKVVEGIGDYNKYYDLQSEEVQRIISEGIISKSSQAYQDAVKNVFGYTVDDFDQYKKDRASTDSENFVRDYILEESLQSYEILEAYIQDLTEANNANLLNIYSSVIDRLDSDYQTGTQGLIKYFANGKQTSQSTEADKMANLIENATDFSTINEQFEAVGFDLFLNTDTNTLEEIQKDKDNLAALYGYLNAVKETADEYTEFLSDFLFADGIKDRLKELGFKNSEDEQKVRELILSDISNLLAGEYEKLSEFFWKIVIDANRDASDYFGTKTPEDIGSYVEKARDKKNAEKQNLNQKLYDLNMLLFQDINNFSLSYIEFLNNVIDRAAEIDKASIKGDAKLSETSKNILNTLSGLKEGDLSPELQDILQNLSTTNPIETVRKLKEASIGAEGKNKDIIDKLLGADEFSVQNQLSQLFGNEDFTQQYAAVEKAFRKNGKLYAEDIKSLADASEEFYQFLQNTDLSYDVIAEWFTGFITKEYTPSEITPDKVKEAKQESQLGKSIQDLSDAVSGFKVESDQKVGIDYLNSAYTVVKDLIEAGLYGDDDLKRYYDFFFKLKENETYDQNKFDYLYEFLGGNQTDTRKIWGDLAGKEYDGFEVKKGKDGEITLTIDNGTDIEAIKSQLRKVNPTYSDNLINLLIADISRWNPNFQQQINDNAAATEGSLTVSGFTVGAYDAFWEGALSSVNSPKFAELISTSIDPIFAGLGVKELEKLQKVIDGLDFTDPQKAIEKLSKSSVEGAKDAAAAIENFWKDYDDNARISYILTQESMENTIESVKELNETGEGLSNKKVKELIKNFKSLEKYLRNDAEGLNKIRKALNALSMDGNEELFDPENLEDFLEILETLPKTFDDVVSEVEDFIENFNEGTDFGEGLNFLGDEAEKALEYLNNNEFGNEPLINIYDMIFGEGAYDRAYKSFDGDLDKFKEYIKKQLTAVQSWDDYTGLGFWRQAESQGLKDFSFTDAARTEFNYDLSDGKTTEDILTDIQATMGISEDAAKMMLMNLAQMSYEFRDELAKNDINKWIESFTGTSLTEGMAKALANEFNISFSMLEEKLNVKGIDITTSIRFLDEDKKPLTGDTLLTALNAQFGGKDLRTVAYEALEQYGGTEVTKEIVYELIPQLKDKGKYGEYSDDIAEEIADILTESTKTEVPVENIKNQASSATSDGIVEGAINGINSLTPETFQPVANNLQTAIQNNKYQISVEAVVTKWTGLIGSLITSKVAANGGLVGSYAVGGTNLSPGQALTGEEGPEIVWNKEEGYAYVAGQNGPEFNNLKPGDKVFTAEETRKIFRNSFAQGGIFGSFASGKDAIGKWTGKTEDENQGKTSTSKPTYWKNELDWLYNLMEDIVELERKQVKFEEDYKDYLKDDSKTGKDLFNLLVKQLGNLYTQLNYQTAAYQKRQTELQQLMAANSQYAQYARYDTENQTIQIDWDAIEAIQDQDTYNNVSDYISALENAQDKMDEAQDALYDIEDKIDELKDQWRDTYIDFEQRVYDAIVKNLQTVIDDYSELNSTITEANASILESIQKEIDLERQIRDNTETEDDITKMESRLAYLRRDTTGANQQEILELEKELEDKRQDYSDTLIDQALEKIGEGNELANEQRSKQIELMQAQLNYSSESGEYWEEVNQMIADATAADGSLLTDSTLADTLKQAENWKGLSDTNKQVWEEELNTDFKEVVAWLLQSESTDPITGEIAGVAAEISQMSSNIGDQAVAINKLADATNGVASAISSTLGSSKVTINNNGYVPTSTSVITQDYRQDKNDEKNGVKKYHVVRQDTNKVCATYDNYADAYSFYKTAAQYREPGTYSILYYKTGGLNTTTGPAWLDGTPSEPEYVLNARQTQAFLKLADVLPSIMSSGNMNTSNSFGSTYINLTMNVDELGSDYDVDRLASKVKDIMYNSASYRNVNVLNFSR